MAAQLFLDYGLIPLSILPPSIERHHQEIRIVSASYVDITIAHSSPQSDQLPPAQRQHHGISVPRGLGFVTSRPLDHLHLLRCASQQL